MPFAYKSNNAIPPAQTFMVFLVSVVVGARRLAHTDWLRADKALHALLGIEHFRGTDTVRNLFKRFGQGQIEAFWRPLWKWLLSLSWSMLAEGFSLDLDSTVIQRRGHQQGAKKGYNPARPGRHSLHPLLAFLAEAPLVLHAWLRSGNTGTARGVVAFLTEALLLMPAAWKLRTVRADSGFFDNTLLSFLEARAIPYIVVARLTKTIKHKAAGLAHWTPIDDHYARAEEKRFSTSGNAAGGGVHRRGDFGQTEPQICAFIAESWGGLDKHKPLIDNILNWKISTSPKLPPNPPGEDPDGGSSEEKTRAA
jgi:hypothetical protein